MTVKELMEILKDADTDMEVTVCAPDSGYYTDEYYEYGFTEKDIDTDFGKFTISVG